MNIPETKLIYFPVSGDREPFQPRIVYVDREWGDPAHYDGNEDLEELHDNRRRWYAKHRCIPYSDAAWELCREWVTRYDAVMFDWLQLPKTAKKAGQQMELFK
jgi:hypothetical protein